MRRFLYLQAFQPIDVRDGALFVNNPMLFVNKAHLSLLYRSLICAISPFKGNYSFPVWGILDSQAGNKTFSGWELLQYRE